MKRSQAPEAPSSQSMVPRRRAGSSAGKLIPSLIAREGPGATKRFVEFFTATIRNKNTRAAYAQAVGQFFAWCEERRFRTLDQIEPIVVAAYIEQHGGSKPTVKQHLAAIRMLFDWLVTGQVVPHNPATSVRGPRHVVKRGTTPVLDAEQARELLDSIDTTTLAGLRDRALIGVTVSSGERRPHLGGELGAECFWRLAVAVSELGWNLGERLGGPLF